MTNTATLDIDSIAVGGDGVARRDGVVVFVPRTAPGDRVVARLEQGRRFARGRVESIVAGSPDRVEPRCAHYDGAQCGGCQLQHLGPEAQRDAKRTIIRDTMRRIGRRTVDLPVYHAAPSPWRYRHRLTLALRRGSTNSWYGGLHSWDDPSAIFALDDCWISDERVLALWREVLDASDLFPDATELRGTVRLAGERGTFVLEGAQEWAAVDGFCARLRSFDSVWWTPVGVHRRRIWSAEGATAESSAAASFTQVNPAVAADLFALVEARVAEREPTHVIDAYSGSGDLALALHARGIRVSAVELDEDASAVAASRLPRPSRAIAARVEDVINGLFPADAVIVNPPRAGLDPRVTQVLDAATSPTMLVYVSCDPATLARDIARMPSWTIESIDAFDMFPQTAHVETVAILVRGVRQ